MLFRGDFDVAFEAANLGVQRSEQVQPRFDATPSVDVRDVGGDSLTLREILHVAADGFEVELPTNGVDVSVEFGALADASQSGAEEVTQAASFPWVGVGQREVAASQESGDDLGIVGIGLGLGCMHGLDAEGVSESEGDGVVAAGVGEPVPGVHALAADEQIGREGFDGLEERFGFGGQVLGEPDGAGLVEDADEESSCVEIDANMRFSSCSQVTHGEASARLLRATRTGGYQPEPSTVSIRCSRRRGMIRFS